MFYSAQIKADYHHFLRKDGAVVSLKRFSELFWDQRQDGQWIKIPKAMREACRRSHLEDDFALDKMVAETDREQACKYEDGMLAKTERLAQAETVLAGYETDQEGRQRSAHRQQRDRSRAAQPGGPAA
ncbi:MAG: hypothetical protein ABI767_08475 [Rhodanobacter sp.]